MKQTDQEKIDYILKEIENMKKIVAGKKADDLESDLVLERAISMTLQIIGEKANQISKKFQEKHPEIEWRKIKGLRNIIAHLNDSVKFDCMDPVFAGSVFHDESITKKVQRSPTCQVGSPSFATK